MEILQKGDEPELYTILLTDNHQLIPSVQKIIMQRSKLVDNIQFLVPVSYENLDMRTLMCMLEYKLPVSKEYHAVFLESKGVYKETHIQYVIEADTNITAEAGDVEMQLSFVNVQLTEDGKNSIQTVRKTGTCSVTITPISAWADVIPDSALTALDQRLIKMDAQIKALDEMNQVIIDNKADNIKYDETTNELQLLSNGNGIGDKVVIKTGIAELEDGVPVVDFDSLSGGSASDKENDDDDNVVEF